jgi:alpha-D-ribose 1-methylphosphonate 5-triphosphate synthase subunit PhnL
MTDLPDLPLLQLQHVAKRFHLHLHGGAELEILRDVTFDLHAGECVVLGGSSGTGKSSILKMIYGNYAADRGAILVRHDETLVDVVTAGPRTILDLRRSSVGYVSQFLRVIPRVGALDIVADAAREQGASLEEARAQAATHLKRLNIREALWELPPARFSGGEQQRINIARCLVARRPILLLDEPTASLDAENRALILDLILEKKRAGAAILGIFHDAQTSMALADRIIDVAPFSKAKAA